jgi:hypothetical protein
VQFDSIQYYVSKLALKKLKHDFEEKVEQNPETSLKSNPKIKFENKNGIPQSRRFNQINQSNLIFFIEPPENGFFTCHIWNMREVLVSYREK